jgi:hypothetical protein
MLNLQLPYLAAKLDNSGIILHIFVQFNRHREIRHPAQSSRLANRNAKKPTNAGCAIQKPGSVALELAAVLLLE